MSNMLLARNMNNIQILLPIPHTLTRNTL